MTDKESLYPFLTSYAESKRLTVCYGINDCETYWFDSAMERQFVQQGIDIMLRDFRRETTKRADDTCWMFYVIGADSSEEKMKLPYIERTFDYSFTVIYPDGDVKLYGFDSPEERKFVQDGVRLILDQMHQAYEKPNQTFIPIDPWALLSNYREKFSDLPQNSSIRDIILPPPQ